MKHFKYDIKLVDCYLSGALLKYNNLMFNLRRSCNSKKLHKIDFLDVRFFYIKVSVHLIFFQKASKSFKTLKMKIEKRGGGNLYGVVT